MPPAQKKNKARPPKVRVLKKPVPKPKSTSKPKKARDQNPGGFNAQEFLDTVGAGRLIRKYKSG